MRKITAAITQMASTQSWAGNCDKAERLVRAAVDQGAGLVLLQELFDADYFCIEQHVRFFADARSPKVRQLQAYPQGVLVLWSAELGWQLRLSVHIDVETEGLGVSSRWARLKLSPAANDYLSPLAPGANFCGMRPSNCVSIDRMNVPIP